MKKSLREKKAKVEGIIAALRTVLENYPVLLNTISNSMEGNSSISFSLSILKMLGVTEQDLVEWLSKLLTETDGAKESFISVLEGAVRALLLTSIKSTYTCSVNPKIPTEVINSGIAVPIEEIDMFKLLNRCPCDDEGKLFYFDNSCEASKLYRSMDFNCYLWYAINKAGITVPFWDNRNDYYPTFKKDANAKNQFCDYFGNTSSSIIMCNGKYYGKREILYATYHEFANMDSNVLKIFLNPRRYEGKTLYDFDFDYIESLKIFDTKTIVSNVINAMLGICDNASITLERKIVQEQVAEIMKSFNTLEEERVTNCSFNFSNKKYNEMLNKAMLKYNGQYESGNETGEIIDFNEEQKNEILNSINSIDESATYTDKRESVAKTIETVSGTLAKSRSVSLQDKFTFESNIITKFIETFTVELAAQMLTPKIAMLFLINDAIMGGENETVQHFSIEQFFYDFLNILNDILLKIIDYILREIYGFIVDTIKPLITELVEKLLLESLNDYMILLESLLEMAKWGKITSNLLKKNQSNFLIDNVNYADIIPVETPKEC